MRHYARLIVDTVWTVWSHQQRCSSVRSHVGRRPTETMPVKIKGHSMRVAGARKSLSRQIQEESEPVRGGKAPHKTKRSQNVLVATEVAQQEPPLRVMARMCNCTSTRSRRSGTFTRTWTLKELNKQAKQSSQTPRKAPGVGESDKIKAQCGPRL